MLCSDKDNPTFLKLTFLYREVELHVVSQGYTSILVDEQVTISYSGEG